VITTGPGGHRTGHDLGTVGRRDDDAGGDDDMPVIDDGAAPPPAGDLDPGLAEALERIGAAATAMRSGDPEPYIACWEDGPDATLLGGWGHYVRGSAALADHFRWVGSRYGGDEGPVQATVENDVVTVGADLAYTVGSERGRVLVDGVEEDMVMRVTHVYRRSGGVWRIVHRHADPLSAE
jgi:ketosteroid isomerase-like protein